MILKEYLEDKPSIFEMIDGTNVFPFILDDTTLLDNLLILLAGEKTVRKSIVDMPFDMVVNVIIHDFKDSWATLAELSVKVNKSLADEVILRQGTGSGTTDQTNSINNINKVSSFNADELLNDTGSEQDGLTNVTNSNTNESVEEKYTLANMFNNLETSQKFKLHRKIIKDIVDSITLSVY